MAKQINNRKLSLHPLRFEEAVTTMMKVKPENKRADKGQLPKANLSIPKKGKGE